MKYMGLRKTILVNNEIYHIYNRGVEKRPIFLIKRDYLRFIELTNYYRFVKCPVKFSYFKKLSSSERENIFNKLRTDSEKLVDIYAFCFMPNHFHFLLKQLADEGISKFITKTSNGFSHYFNIRHERVGHLFQGNFKAVRIEDDEQFIHISRYIHLNPVSSYIIQPEKLGDYEYSSYPEYIGEKVGFCNTKEILSFFPSSNDYKKFVNDQVDYARQLENIKHIILEQ